MSSRTLAFGALLLGGLLAVVSAAQSWWRATGGGATIVLTGSQATGGLSQALAVVALVGTLLVLVLRVRGRRVVALLLTLTGAGAALVGLLRLRPSDELVLTQLRRLSLVGGADGVALRSTGWPWVYAVAGLLVVLGALVLLLRVRQWPTRADRFQRPGEVAELDADDPAQVWKALDAGLDPTDRPSQAGLAGGAHPDVQK